MLFLSAWQLLLCSFYSDHLIAYHLLNNNHSHQWHSTGSDIWHVNCRDGDLNHQASDNLTSQVHSYRNQTKFTGYVYVTPFSYTVFFFFTSRVRIGQTRALLAVIVPCFFSRDWCSLFCCSLINYKLEKYKVRTILFVYWRAASCQ